jgi:hypothetical protein
MTIREAKLIGLLMRSTEKHKGQRSHGSFGINVPCDCTECKFVAFVWANMIWIEDLEW